MSRIEQVMRELSDLRDFYLKLQRRHDALEAPHTAAAAESPADYNAGNENRSLPWAGNAKSREQAALLRQHARLGGLKFEAYLPPDIADWILEQVERGVFRDPGEAMFVYMTQAKDISVTPGLADMIEEAILSERCRKLDSGETKTYSWEEVRARLESDMRERQPAVYWKKIPWSKEES